MLQAPNIEKIVTEELQRSRNKEIQHRGGLLLEDWKNSAPSGEYCQKIIIPMIGTLSRRSRGKALEVLRKVKERIADAAANAALEHARHRRSADAMREETLSVYDVIERQGRGIVYFGSARTKPGEPEYEAGRELGREIATLLPATSWSGAGPGAMESPIRGAKEAGGQIGGIKIHLTDTESSFEQNVAPVFDGRDVVECKFFGPRKVGLVDAAMAGKPGDPRAVVVFPGGFGTMDEFFELVTLKQLNKLGTKGKLPIVLMNYGKYYDLLMDFIHKCKDGKKIKPEDLELFTICETNEEALDYLADEYDVPPGQRTYRSRLVPHKHWFPEKNTTDEIYPLFEGVQLYDTNQKTAG